MTPIQMWITILIHFVGFIKWKNKEVEREMSDSAIAEFFKSPLGSIIVLAIALVFMVGVIVVGVYCTVKGDKKDDD